MVVREEGRGTREEYRGGDGGDAHDAELVSRCGVKAAVIALQCACGDGYLMDADVIYLST